MRRLHAMMREAHVKADIAGRPKHIYSIWNKMRNKSVDVEGVYDLRALRLLVHDLKDCYTALGIVHQLWTPVPREFDDYIARPKANGYQSLHTVVITEDGRPMEVQIRTHEMHQHAEYGVAAHWRYKETGPHKASFAASEQDQKIAWLRQLLAWKKDVTEVIAEDAWQVADLDDRIYVLSPQGRVVELARDATPVDFAYHLHSDLGHRCRGAKVDGAMVPLNTRLSTGQTVEILTDKRQDAGPSRDWLNPELGYLQSPRARAKVRAWFNALDEKEALATGRALVERELQREGKTAVNLQDLAMRLGFDKPDDLFLAASRPEFHPRSIEAAFETKTEDDPDALVRQRLQNLSEARKQTKSSVLVVGVDVLTQLARCCRPSPPDEIAGFVTRGKGVSIHRTDCSNFKNLQIKDAARVIECTWGNQKDASYAADLRVLAVDRQGLLRDISEVLAKERINVTAVNTQTARGQARMVFTVQIASGPQLDKAMLSITEIKGVIEARRR
jgi:GTP pyrophosphokinase